MQQTSGDDHPGVRYYFFSLGVPALVVGGALGLAMTMPDYFWLGIWTVYAGTMWFVVDLWIFNPGLSWGKKSAGCIGVALFFIVTLLIGFRPTWIFARSYSDKLDIHDGQTLFGLLWDNRYYHMKSVVRNGSGSQYSSVEIYIRTNLFIKQIVSSMGDGCSYKPYWPGDPFAFPTFSETNIKTGVTTNTPMAMDISTVYRISCEKLLSNTSLEVVSVITGPPEWALTPIPFRPSWTMMEIHYVSYGRPEKERVFQCFSKPCERVPPTVFSEPFGMYSSIPK